MKPIYFIFTTACILFLSIVACKKTYDAKPTYANPAIAGTWAKPQQFYSPLAERFVEATNTWRRFTAFTFTSDGEPDKLGFANPYVAGRGTAALDMTNIYASQDLTSDSGYYNITIPKCFQFIPQSKDTVTKGTVKVLEQNVKIYRKDKTSFDIKISPSDTPGVYNTITGIFEIEVQFDETSIGGTGSIKRKYRFTTR